MYQPSAPKFKCNLTPLQKIYILKLLLKRGIIAPEKQFLLLFTIFYLLLWFYVRTGARISFRDKRLFEITEVEIARVDFTCITIKS